MTQDNLLRVQDLSRQLGAGRATITYILDRFSHRFSSRVVNGMPLYPPSVIPLLKRIQDLLSDGMLPLQVEDILENEKAAESRNRGSDDADIPMNPRALAFIQDMVKDIRAHQERIAVAHEKRAQAEERKAEAIEKRAQAEEKKAEAMNNIAAALQEMNQLRAVDTRSIEIAGQTAQALNMDFGEQLDTGSDLDADDYDDDFEDPLAGMEALLDLPETAPETPVSNLQTTDASPIEVDDHIDDLYGEPLEMSDEIPGHPPGDSDDLDDLSLLIEPKGADIDSRTDDQDDLTLLLDAPLMDESPILPELDDLSMLIDDTVHADTGTWDGKTDLDDLSQLIDTPAVSDDSQKSLADPSRELDDLSALVDEPSREHQSQPAPMDDLSLLVDDGLPLPEAGIKNEAQETMDDLWALADDDQGTATGDAGSVASIDDLSALIDPVDADQPSLKPDISPEQDMAKYKTAVMKIIIDLKSQGLSAKDTTERLNQEQIATLSGKDQWSETAISKIFGFIESAR